MSKISHLDESGNLNMVDISHKEITLRRAQAKSVLQMAPSTLQMIYENSVSKGDVLGVARVAGIQAAKRVSELIPLCHSLAPEYISIDFNVVSPGCLEIISECRLTGRTGVEMEALTATSISALTVYDMLKSVQKDIIISQTYLLSKSGGKSGEWRSNLYAEKHTRI